MNYIHILGYIAGITVVISLLPQVIKSWRTKQTKDISLWRSIIYVIGVALWSFYGILINNNPILAMNLVGLLLGGIILILKIKYK